ncbi:3'-5' exonuclease [Lactococcus hircilactis]|uniref:DNA polymerase III polC-type n=1 Tax=Lactococcus hircilactis TaxID=1494462 RepID=A0A7X2D0V3_9LACT|nr:3'-5' exonuclease [Lactococcus hircilactis]MQW38842.1 3'-5' exonuclease [Lactococcus hircilactis]
MSYVVFDFETTGLSAQKNEIIQIGAIKFDENHQEIARFNQLVKPTRSYVSTTISNLTGISQRSLLDQPVITDVLPEFLTFIKNSLLVAHNAPFDVSFLYQAMIDCRIQNAEHFQVYDTLTQAKKWMKAKSYKLEDLKDYFECDVRSHDAINDCVVTALLYQHLQEIEHPKKAVSTDKNYSEQLSLFTAYQDEGIDDGLRRKLGLPMTKTLMYFHLTKEKVWERFEITQISITQIYSSGYSLCITLFNQEKINIHSDFLVQMQKKNFISEMQKEESKEK